MYAVIEASSDRRAPKSTTHFELDRFMSRDEEDDEEDDDEEENPLIQIEGSASSANQPASLPLRPTKARFT